MAANLRHSATLEDRHNQSDYHSFYSASDSNYLPSYYAPYTNSSVSFYGASKQHEQPSPQPLPSHSQSPVAPPRSSSPHEKPLPPVPGLARLPRQSLFGSTGSYQRLDGTITVDSALDSEHAHGAWRAGQSNQVNTAMSRSPYQDTPYYGAQGGQEGKHTPDGQIPLQERPRHHGSTSSSERHYERRPKRTPGSGSDFDNDNNYTRKRPKLRFGELGMMGGNKKRFAWVVWLLTSIQICVFIAELVKNAQLTGSPIQSKPYFNPMIGPSNYVLINMGCKFVPCMHLIPDSEFPKSIPWSCPNSTSDSPTDPNNRCSLGELCGFGAPHTNDNPNQWFRFILPIFMHAGFVHILFNLLLQITMGRDMEQAIGSMRFFLVYMSSGIFGFVMGANYGGSGMASVGASGALFGVTALTLLDLLYSWRERRSPGRELAIILVEIVVSFGLGLLPGLDNFAHIGGFIMGLALGVCILHSPNHLRFAPGGSSRLRSAHKTTGLLKNPVGFFQGRKPLWWAWWLVRAGALLLVIIGFILLLNNFYVTRNTCNWCKYLSCIPINNWCKNRDIRFITVPDAAPNHRRDVVSRALLTLPRLFLAV